MGLDLELGVAVLITILCRKVAVALLDIRRCIRIKIGAMPKSRMCLHNIIVKDCTEEAKA